eukprot:7998820-Alexandrium_andersonii.AAC.1
MEPAPWPHLPGLARLGPIPGPRERATRPGKGRPLRVPVRPCGSPRQLVQAPPSCWSPLQGQQGRLRPGPHYPRGRA